MQPTASQVHVDAALTTISTAYIQSSADFIATKVFPQVPVDRQSGRYFTYTKNDWFRDEATIRPPATESAGSGYGLSTDSYFCDVYAFHKDVPDQIEANADVPINPEGDAARFVAQRMLIRNEIQWASDYFATSIWGTDSTPSALWDVYATSKPLVDVETARTTILSNTGFMPNTLVLGYNVYAQLINHPDFVDRLKYTSGEVVTRDVMARLFRVDNLYVCQAVKATNVEGEAAAYAFAHGKHALLCYVNPTPSPLMPSAGYQFVWRGVSDGMLQSIGTVRIPMPELRAMRIESQVAWDNKVVGSDLGYFFNSVVS